VQGARGAFEILKLVMLAVLACFRFRRRTECEAQCT